MTATKSERIEARLEPAEKETLVRAADACGQRLTEFILGAALAAADEVLTDRRTVVPPDYFDQLLAELDRPAESVLELDKAIVRARDTKLLRTSSTL